MSEFLSILKELNTSAKESAILAFILGSFWTIPFLLFKPQFFEFPFYAQIALIFALTVIWLVAILLTSSHIFNAYINPKANPLRLGTVIAIILLNISILVSYYYSLSFTHFLQYAYGILGVYWILVVIVFNIAGLKKVKKHNTPALRSVQFGDRCAKSPDFAHIAIIRKGNIFF